MKFIKAETADINDFRAALYQRFSGPLDAMWEALYIASAQPYLIEMDNQTIGYACIDVQDSLLQIYLEDDHQHKMHVAIDALIKSQLISSARLSSIEAVSFNACLAHSQSIGINTYCYQYAGNHLQWPTELPIELVTGEDIPAVKAFLNEQIGFNDNFGYTENLVNRKEMYLVKDADGLMATSECRLSDTQSDYADLGIIVNKNYQGKGIATQIMAQQAKRAQSMGRKPICSTTLDNIASQKAIEKAGFYRTHIIFDMGFVTDEHSENP